MIRCAIYDRVSTDLQVRDGLSLDAQKQALTDYALAHHYTIVDYYTDEGITARKKMQNRKDLLRLLNDVKADKIDLILVTKLDRWFRNIKDYHNTQAVLEAHNCNWKTIFEEYDTSTSNGRFAINIMLSVNENECDRDSERIRSVFAYKKSHREYLSGRPAYGYLVNEQKQLVIDTKTKPVVEDIFACYFQTCSKKETIRYIQNKYGTDAPSCYQIHRVLSSPTYCGCLYGISGYCDAYISPGQFQQLTSTVQTKAVYHQQEPYLFSSLIRCPVCGKNLSGFVKKSKRKDGTYRLTKSYRCSSRNASPHRSACLSEKRVEAFALTQTENQLIAEQNTLLQTKLQCLLETLRHSSESSVSALPKQSAASLLAERERLNQLYLKARITEHFYEEKYQLLTEQITQINAAHRSAFANSPEPSGAIFQPESSALSVTGFSAPSPSGTPENSWQAQYMALSLLQKKTFWKRLLSSLQIDAQSHKLCGCTFHLVQ